MYSVHHLGGAAVLAEAATSRPQHYDDGGKGEQRHEAHEHIGEQWGVELRVVVIGSVVAHEAEEGEHYHRQTHNGIKHGLRYALGGLFTCL